MKKRSLLFTLAAATTIITLCSNITGPAATGNGNKSSTGCAGSTCHGNANSNNTVVGLIFVDKVTGQVVSNSKYIPGRGYTLYVVGDNSNGRLKFGFQLTSVQKLNQGMQAGTFSNWPGSGQVHRTTLAGVDVMEHGAVLTGKLVGSVGHDTVKMDWTAPTSAAGTVRFYYAVNCVNNNGQADAGDEWNNSLTELDPDATAVGEVNATMLNLYPNPATDILHIAPKVAGTYRVSVYDAALKAVSATTISYSGQGDAVTIPVSDLRAGSYFLVAEGNGVRQAAAFIKQ